MQLSNLTLPILFNQAHYFLTTLRAKLMTLKFSFIRKLIEILYEITTCHWSNTFNFFNHALTAVEILGKAGTRRFEFEEILVP